MRRATESGSLSCREGSVTPTGPDRLVIGSTVGRGEPDDEEEEEAEKEEDEEEDDEDETGGCGVLDAP
jgi:ribosomal protein L12E/L44/L45/RPP1/RPP2